MSITNKLRKIIDDKNSLVAVLRDKGVDVPDDVKLSELPSLIENMGGGDDDIVRGLFQRNIEDIIVPDGTTAIANTVFNGYTALKTIQIPSSVKSIGDYCFKACENLNTVTLNEGLESVGQYAFQQCGSIKSVIFPDSVTSIGANVFNTNSKKSALQYISVGRGVTTIPDKFIYATVVSNIPYITVDFTRSVSIPTVASTITNAFRVTDYTIVVPDTLYDEWIVADKWSTIESHIIKKSDYDAQQIN